MAEGNDGAGAKSKEPNWVEYEERRGITWFRDVQEAYMPLGGFTGSYTGQAY